MIERMMITGSRKITDRDYIFKCLKSIYKRRKFDFLIHGGAKGVDSIAEEWAGKKGIPVLKFLPDWSSIGISAAVKRNTTMADQCDFGVAIWDGKSKGTIDAMKKLKSRRKLFKVFKYEEC